MAEGRCELCGREVARLERHHLIPRTRHRNRRNKKNFDRREVHERIALLCRACHRQLHAVLAEKQLEYDYNTLEAIRSHPEMRRFVRWVRRVGGDKTVRVRRRGGDDTRRELIERRRRRRNRGREAGE